MFSRAVQMKNKHVVYSRTAAVSENSFLDRKKALFLDRINILFKPERKWTELLPYAQTSENFFDQRWLDILMKFSICQDLHRSSKKAMYKKRKAMYIIINVYF